MLQKISTMVPTEEEKQKIQEAQLANPDVPLGSAEQFLLALSSITELTARLQLWAFKMDYETAEQVNWRRSKGERPAWLCQRGALIWSLQWTEWGGGPLGWALFICRGGGNAEVKLTFRAACEIGLFWGYT